MIIYVNITDRRTDKHIKSIVWNLTKIILKFLLQIYLLEIYSRC